MIITYIGFHYQCPFPFGSAHDRSWDYAAQHQEEHLEKPKAGLQAIASAWFFSRCNWHGCRDVQIYSYTSTSIESQNAGKYSTLKTSLHGCGGNNWSETSRINRSFFAFSKDPEKDLLYAIFWIHRCIYIFIRAKALNYRAWSGMVKNRYQRSIHGLVLYLDIKEIYRLIWNVWVSMFICECHPEHSMGQKAFLAHLAIPQACHSWL